MGRKKFLLKKAATLVKERIGPIVRESSLYQTAAWGKTDQPGFLNQVLEVHTSASPANCMACLLQIESEMGRIRSEKNGPRTIDLDILYYDDAILNSTNLTIPHPFIAERRFVLTPLAEIWPDYLHPVHMVSNARLLQQCPDELDVKKL